MTDLHKYALSHEHFSFRELLEKQSSKVQVIVTFLAILELMKTGVIQIRQDQLFDDIEITSLKYGEQMEEIETDLPQSDEEQKDGTDRSSN